MAIQLLTVVGARPQFIKAFALSSAIASIRGAIQPRPTLYGDGHAADAIAALLDLL